MKKLLKILCFGLLVSMLFSFAACGGDYLDERVKYDRSKLSEFIKNYDKTSEFSDDLVIVVLTDDASKQLNEYTVKSFSQVRPASIEKVGKNFIYITISKTGRENVLRAVYILRLRSDVELAEPNFVFGPANELSVLTAIC